MKVLLINQFFFPDVAAVAQLMTDLAEDLTEKGVEVGVLCGRTKYNRERNSNDSARTLSRAIKIYRVPALNLRGRSGAVHALNYLSFHLTALLRALFLPRYDASVVFTNPPLIPFVGWVLRRLKGTRFIQVVEDLYPDVAVELGFLDRHGIVARHAERISRFLFQRSDRVVALGDAMKRVLVGKKVDEESIATIPNWADGKEILPIARHENWFLDQHGLRGRFVVQYSGHMGEGHDFQTILEAAKLLKDHEEIVVLFIGDGPRREEIASFKSEQGLDNITILPYQERRNLRFSLSAADIALISLSPGLENLMFPCKLYGIMAAGGPFIYIGSDNGEIGQIGREAGCGFTVCSGDVDGLHSLILRLSKDHAEIEELGARARRHFLGHYDRHLATARYHEILVQVLNVKEKTGVR